MTIEQPRLALHQLSLYNAGRMAPEQVIAVFAARRPVLDRVIGDLAAERPKSRAQHHLIVGQRGMGKTMLLARIAAELRANAELSKHFIPLVFAEEQYAVDRLSKFWLNCLDSLADACESAKDPQTVAAIDATVAQLSAAGIRSVKEDQPFADEVYTAFAETARRLGRRPVLLVDNLQIVFERLDDRQQHSLRELLMRPGVPILIGTSPSPPPESQDYGAAFYDHLKVHYLRPLEESEMRDLLVHLADAAQRDDVRQRVLQHPARLTVLRQLTGGNPRTTLTLFLLYAEDFSPTVFGDLEGLLDRVTPLYKARIEELTAQQQVIVSAIASHWDPITGSEISDATALPTGTISGQLDRLEKIGTIERVELFGESRTGYQIAERFFNIWFLMRSASRRQRREVEFLTRFLESFYEPPDRIRLARHLLKEERFSPDRYLWSRAVADSLTAPEAAAELKRHSELVALREVANDARRRMHELIDFRSLPAATLAFDDLRKKLKLLVGEGMDVTPDDFAKAVLGDRAMFVNGERNQLAARTDTPGADEIHSVLETISKSRKSDVLLYSEEAVAWFSERLASGQLRNRDDAEDWNRAFHQAVGKQCIRLMVGTLPHGFGALLSDSTIEAIHSALQPDDSGTVGPWLIWGGVLHKLSRYAEAESAYRKAIAQDPSHAFPWIGLGSLLEDRADYTGAEAAFRKAIVREPKLSWPCSRLAYVLEHHLLRYAEAELAYREAIARDPTNGWHWISLGDLLSHELHHYAEAEAAYREAIALDPVHALPWRKLGDLLAEYLQRFVEAETAYREAINRDRKDPFSWNGLGNLYCDHMGRQADAAEVYDSTISLDPTHEGAYINRIFLRRDFMGDVAAARPLMAELLALPKHEFPDTMHLHEALFAAYDANWGLACEALEKALVRRGNGFHPTNTDDWLRASAVLLHLNYGEDLLAFLERRGDHTRLRPWVEALRALQIGDRRALQNVAPEIRITAEVLFDGIERRLLKLPATTRRRPDPSATRPRTANRGRKVGRRV